MKKLIALGLMAISMNTAFAADGTYNRNHRYDKKRG